MREVEILYRKHNPDSYKIKDLIEEKIPYTKLNKNMFGKTDNKNLKFV